MVSVWNQNWTDRFSLRTNTGSFPLYKQVERKRERLQMPITSCLLGKGKKHKKVAHKSERFASTSTPKLDISVITRKTIRRQKTFIHSKCDYLSKKLYFLHLLPYLCVFAATPWQRAKLEFLNSHRWMLRSPARNIKCKSLVAKVIGSPLCYFPQICLGDTSQRQHHPLLVGS